MVFPKKYYYLVNSDWKKKFFYKEKLSADRFMWTLSKQWKF